MLLRLLRRQLSIYINTSSAPERCLKLLLRRRKGVCKYFATNGAGEVFIYTYLISLRRRRSLESIYVHLSGAG